MNHKKITLLICLLCIAFSSKTSNHITESAPIFLAQETDATQNTPRCNLPPAR